MDPAPATESPGGLPDDEPAQATTAELEASLDWVRRSPADAGHVELIVRRPGVEAREVLEEAQLVPTEGLVGDNWRLRRSSSTPGGSPDPERQLTLMNARLVSLVALRRDRWQLAGDQLYVDLDLSVENAPAGTRLQVGGAVIELTTPPHLGCAKFVARFGDDAMRFVNSPTGRALRLRGANAKIVIAGWVRHGDPVTKLGARAEN
jgi:MOSC domain-containing protein YiiM